MTYVPYPIPKKAIFSAGDDSREYAEPPVGWKYKDEECLVLGETEMCYVTEIITSLTPMWENGVRYNRSSTVHVGFHKSRFVKWLDTQIELF